MSQRLNQAPEVFTVSTGQPGSPQGLARVGWQGWHGSQEQGGKSGVGLSRVAKDRERDLATSGVYNAEELS